MINTNVFFTPTNTEPLDEVVQLMDNVTKECVFYVRCDTPGTYVDDHVIYRKSVNTFYKRQFDNGINVKWFGVKGDGITDDTAAFKQAMQIAYNLSTPSSGWKSPVKIRIPYGKYIIKGNLIDASMDSARFVFEGDGWQSTEIIYLPDDSNEFMLDNQAIIGFTTFQGIKFTSDNEGKFLNFVGSGSDNAQSMIFEKCFFQDFNQIIVCSEYTMTSEVTFTDCKIRGGGASAIYFVLNNDQGVNWRFYGTDIESFDGVCFDFHKGQSMYVYQGSIIPNSGAQVIRVVENADPNTFGGGTSPEISMWGVRFELKNAILINLESKTVNFIAKFDCCGMGGSNITNGQPAVYTKGIGTLIFDTCYNFNNFLFSHEIDDASDYLNPVRVIFRNSAPVMTDIDQNICNIVTNISSYPVYIFDNCNTNSWYRPWHKAAQNSHFGWNVSKHVSGVSANSDGAYLSPVSIGNTYKINLKIPDQYITERKIVFKKASDVGAYYDQVHHIKIYDKTETVLLAEADLDTNEGLILHDPRLALLHEDDKYIIHLTPIVFNGNDLVIGINLIAEY